jgi:ectoine hydroxylase-related dioxygenase (phytanoyl-CoA dioxygenase family)
MEDNLKQMREQGYTVLRDVAPIETTDRIRKVVLRLSQETQGRARGRSASLLLGRDPAFEEVVLNAKLQVLVEHMCGKGALLSQLIASIRPKGAPALALHADQNWTPAPFPDHNQLLTACWACDDFSEPGGATKVIPRSHLYRRHPSPTEIEASEGAIAIECPKGSLPVWDGSVWHGNYPRRLDSERVVVHITFGRLALRTVENYDHLDEKWLEGKPHELSVMLGREDFLGSTTIERGFADYTKLPNTFAWAKT